MSVGAGFPGTPCLPQDPLEKHSKRRELSGPAPFQAPIIPASRLPTSSFSPTPSPSHFSSAGTTYLPTLRGVGKQKGGWVSCFSWQRAPELDQERHWDCPRRRGWRFLDSWWL